MFKCPIVTYTVIVLYYWTSAESHSNLQCLKPDVLEVYKPTDKIKTRNSFFSHCANVKKKHETLSLHRNKNLSYDEMTHL